MPRIGGAERFCGPLGLIQGGRSWALQVVGAILDGSLPPQLSALPTNLAIGSETFSGG